MLKKYGKDSLELTKTGVTLGVGANLANTNANASQALGNASKALPLTGKVMGAGMVLNSVKQLYPGEELRESRKKRHLYEKEWLI